MVDRLAATHLHISEAFEGYRSDLIDIRSVPDAYRSRLEMNMADAILSILDIADHCSLNVERAMTEIIAYRNDQLVRSSGVIR